MKKTQTANNLNNVSNNNNPRGVHLPNCCPIVFLAGKMSLKTPTNVSDTVLKNVGIIFTRNVENLNFSIYISFMISTGLELPADLLSIPGRVRS